MPAPDEVPLSYMEMADGTGQMAGALQAIAEAPQAVLFHCTAGKDRTGVVAALLLWLAGVSEEDILADYIVSGPYLQQMLRAKMHKRGSQEPIKLPSLNNSIPEHRPVFRHKAGVQNIPHEVQNQKNQYVDAD